VTVVYDAGALVAAERSNRALWADHRVRLELGLVPLTTAAVVAQVSRSPHQVQLRRFLSGCEILPLAASEAHEVGSVAGASGVSDVVDVHVVLVAARSRAPVVTSHQRDLASVVGALADPVRLVRI
jgi:hypothetical protein